jgi:hypothetical protein
MKALHAEQQRNSRQPIEASSSPSFESRSLPTLPPQARFIARPAQPSRSSSSDVLISEQMKALQLLQREDPDDQEKVERFIKVWVLLLLLMHFTFERVLTIYRELWTTNLEGSSRDN